jgi:hypothetical protein
VKYVGYVKSSVGGNLFYILILFDGSEIKIYIGLEVWKFVNNFDGEMYLVKTTWKTNP